MAKGKAITTPQGNVGDYHAVRDVHFHRPCCGTAGSVMATIAQFKDEAARRADAQSMELRQVRIPYDQIDASVMEAFMAQVWKCADVCIDDAPADDPLADLQGGTDVFESGQSPAP